MALGEGQRRIFRRGQRIPFTSDDPDVYHPRRCPRGDGEDERGHAECRFNYPYIDSEH
jgi:hypothetical protein